MSKGVKGLAGTNLRLVEVVTILLMFAEENYAVACVVARQRRVTSCAA
jgi:hypothetical protein